MSVKRQECRQPTYLIAVGRFDGVDGLVVFRQGLIRRNILVIVWSGP